MNWEKIAGNWNQYAGKIKEKWGSLTDDELTMISGKRDQFLGKLQGKYGLTKERAEKAVEEFLKELDGPA